MSLHLARLSLSRAPGAAALSGLLNPAEAGRAMDAHHRLLWTLFADETERRRDFLWRAEGKGRFLALSAREPIWSPGGLWDPPEVKAFAPDLRVSDRLGFVLRANATRTRRIGPLGADGQPARVHVDVVMDALHSLPPGRESSARSEARLAVAQEQGATWLIEQGKKHGFIPEAVTVADYSVMALPAHRGPRRGQPQFGVLEMTGVLRVTEPESFLAKLAQGFGRARAFGCGLMLIRRAP